MYVGVLTLEFELHGNDSLKGKRKVALSLKQKLRNKFNVAVSEVAMQDSHTRLVLGVATTGPDRKIVESRLEKVVNHAEAATWAELAWHDVEVFGA